MAMFVLGHSSDAAGTSPWRPPVQRGPRSAGIASPVFTVLGSAIRGKCPSRQRTAQHKTSQGNIQGSGSSLYSLDGLTGPKCDRLPDPSHLVNPYGDGPESDRAMGRDKRDRERQRFVQQRR
jgi:hypothetical protein